MILFGRRRNGFTPADWNELDDYFYRELHPRAMNILEQEKAMRSQAEKTWGRYSPTKRRCLSRECYGSWKNNN